MVALQKKVPREGLVSTQQGARKTLKFIAASTHSLVYGTVGTKINRQTQHVDHTMLGLRLVGLCSSYILNSGILAAC